MEDKMIFYLMSEQTGQCYWFSTLIENQDDFEEFCFREDFEKFMHLMEVGSTNPPEKWTGVHDGTGNEASWGYESYEIEDFDKAIEKWFDFFSSVGLLPEGAVKHVSSNFESMNLEVRTLS